jgi:hypothetical protein
MAQGAALFGGLLLLSVPGPKHQPPTERDDVTRRQALTFAGAVVVVALRKTAPKRMPRSGIVGLALGVAITLAGVQYQIVGIMLFGIRPTSAALIATVISLSVRP